MLKDPINVLYDNLDAIIGNPKDFKEVKGNSDQTFSIPQAMPAQAPEDVDKQSEELPKNPQSEKAVTPPNDSKDSEMKEEPKFQPKPQETVNKRESPNTAQSHAPPAMPQIPQNSGAGSDSFTPIKALTTFSRDWIICARVT